MPFDVSPTLSYMVVTSARSRLFFALLVLAAAAVWRTSAANAQTSVYYLTAGDDGVNFAFQNGAAINSWSQQTNEYPIAVTDTVRTLGPNSGDSGSQYTLGGTFTGTTYTNSAPSGDFYDGTSDGTSNYSVDFDTGNVYRFNADWSGATLLFTAVGDDLGITYDPSNSSLWVQNYSDGGVTDFSLDGTVLGSFSTGLSDTGSLARDPADGTFWCTSQDSTGTLYQFNSSGTQLSSFTDPTAAGLNFLGGEFVEVPEPSTWAALLSGGLVLAVAVRVRRRAA